MEKRLIASFSESRNGFGYPDTFYNTFEIKHNNQIIHEKGVTIRKIVSPGNVDYVTELKYVNMANVKVEFDTLEDALL